MIARLRAVVIRVRDFLFRRRGDEDFDAEMASHLALLVESFERRGLSADAARRAAALQFGGPVQTIETQRDQRGLPALDALLQDIRYGWRMMRKARGLTFVGLVTLAVGIGATAAMLSIIDAVLVRGLPYPGADRLIDTTGEDQARGLTGLGVSFTRYHFIRERSKTLEAFGVYASVSVNLTQGGTPERVQAAHATQSLFDVLGATPVVGRGFSEAEEREGGPDVVLLSDSLWHSHFGGDSGIVGHTISLDGHPVTVVGILPPDFTFPFVTPAPQVWLPRVDDDPVFDKGRIRAGAAYLTAYAKLRPGVSLGAAQTEIDAIGRQYQDTFPGQADNAPGTGLRAGWLKTTLVGTTTVPLEVLLGAVGLVLLIGTANLASLILARSASRRRELALRRALGGTGRRVARQLLVESLMLTSIGGVTGIALAYGVLPALRSLPAGTLPRVDDIHVSSAAVWISLALSMAIGVLFGLLPVLQTQGTDLHLALREGTRGSTDGAAGGRLRRGLVIAEVAVALVLVSSAALLLRSFVNLMRVNPGFEAANVLTASVTIPVARYRTAVEQTEFFRRFAEHVEALPSVEAAGVTSYLPINGGTRFVSVCPQGTVCRGIGKDPIAALRQVTPGYLKAMGIAVTQGRPLDSHDLAGATRVGILNDVAAKAFFGDANPIGRHVMIVRGSLDTEIVGVVPSVRFLGLATPSRPELYVPQTQFPSPAMSLVVRSPTGADSLVTSVRTVLRELDRDVPLANVIGMEDVVSASIAQPRLTTGLTGVFGMIALVLAAIGTYGVMAYSVSRRREEMALRLALGATPRNILTMVTGQGLRLVAFGVAIGLVASIGATRFLTTLLFGVDAWDPATLVSVTGILVVVATAACYLPARRATRTNPVAALRGE